jgi:hypothetical protein
MRFGILGGPDEGSSGQTPGAGPEVVFTFMVRSPVTFLVTIPISASERRSAPVSGPLGSPAPVG